MVVRALLAVVAAFTLAEGRSPPALSLYAEVAPGGALVRHETRVNRVPKTNTSTRRPAAIAA